MKKADALPESAGLAVFDVCDTLYHTNTTIGFIRCVARQSPAVDRAVKRWTLRSSPFYYLGAITYRSFAFDLARRRLVAALRGVSRDILKSAADEYVRETLPALANQAIHDRLQYHQRANHRIILISSSLDIVVASIANVLGVEFRASTLGFREGRCTGRIETDLTGRKAAALGPLIDRETSPVWVYTDNRSDRDILSLADRPVVVLPRGANYEWGRPVYDHIKL